MYLGPTNRLNMYVLQGKFRSELKHGPTYYMYIVPVKPMYSFGKY